MHGKLKDRVQKIFEEIDRTTSFDVTSVAGFYYRSINNPYAKPPYRLSNHSFGFAIDINPTDNLFNKHDTNLVDTNTRLRTNAHPVVQIFQKYGFGWGGKYGDYMHFSYPDGA